MDRMNGNGRKVRCMDCANSRNRYCPMTASIVAPMSFRVCNYFRRLVLPTNNNKKESK